VAPSGGTLSQQQSGDSATLHVRRVRSDSRAVRHWGRSPTVLPG